MKYGTNIIAFLLLLGLISCKQAGDSQSQTEENDPFEATWESLQNYECPEWFKDAKFGIYTHWGAYSVPAWENEWYPRLMYSPEDKGRGSMFYDHHKETWGDVSESVFFGPKMSIMGICLFWPRGLIPGTITPKLVQKRMI